MWQKSFLVSLGEFDPNLEYYREQDWIVFLLCCIFNIIVLLNLLIAIISETFTKISEQQVLPKLFFLYLNCLFFQGKRSITSDV